MRPGEIRSTISMKLSTARQHFAQALRDVYGSIPAHNGKLTSQASLLSGMPIGHRSSLCRYLQGKNLPPKDFVERFYRAVSELTNGTLPWTCEELLAMHEKAEAADGRRRAARRDGKRQIDALTRQVDELSADNARLVALPVPPAAGDRQGNTFPPTPVPQSAVEAIELATRGQDELTVTLLSRLSEHVDIDELALCIVHFRRRRHDDLADTLIRIYGRDHREDRWQQQVIRLSMTLREHQLQSDADALLTTLVER